jgi:hypothetical protein
VDRKKGHFLNPCLQFTANCASVVQALVMLGVIKVEVVVLLVVVVMMTLTRLESDIIARRTTAHNK